MRKLMRSLAIAALSLAAGLPAWSLGAQVAVPAPGPVVELRQYKIVPGKREEFIPFFEQEFVETQDKAGMPLIGQFRDLDDADRFVWLRSFSDMAERQRALTDFYTGPVWKAHRDRANPMLDDNDNVLLLKPAGPGSGFEAPPPRPAPGTGLPARSVVVVNIHYLWKDPGEGFAAFFLSRMAPRLRAGGLPVLGAYVTETSPNTFPRLPVRQSEKVLVWFTRAPDTARYKAAMRRVSASREWKASVAPALADYEERAAQTLYLSPTPRSALR
jgi:hypothetical protein